MEDPVFSNDNSSLGEEMPRRSLRRRAAEGLRLSFSKPISNLFHRHIAAQDESLSPMLPQTIAATLETPSFAPHTPGSLRSVKSLFGSFRSNKLPSINPGALETSLPVKKQGTTSNATPRSLRDKFRQTFSRPENIRAERSSSPIDIPTVKKDVDPLQQPIPSDLTDDSGNPLQQRMLNSPSQAYFCRCSSSNSANPSPQIPQQAAASPMPGTTFTLDDLGGKEVPFEQAYDEMAIPNQQPSRITEVQRDFSDPFLDSPKRQEAGPSPILRSSRSRSPHKSSSSLREAFLQLPATPMLSQRLTAITPLESRNGTRSSDAETLKEVSLPDIAEDYQTNFVNHQSPRNKAPQEYTAGSSANTNFYGKKTRISRIKSMPDALMSDNQGLLPPPYSEPVKVLRKSVKYVNESIFFGQRSERPLFSSRSVTRISPAELEDHAAFDSSIDCSTDMSDESIDSRRLRRLRKSKSSSDESGWLSATTVEVDDVLASGGVDGGSLKRYPHRSNKEATWFRTASANDGLD